ncbi:chorion protein domain-containing protein [Phthorimaea operculella]|nr:chorion protein domain-containing protein [Phthorimaea operculella]
MLAKTVLLFVAQLLLTQAVISQCIREPACACGSNNYAANSLSNFGLTDNYVNFPFPAGFPLPSQPIGISVSADNLIIDGCLNAVGSLPFFSSVLIDGTVPSQGQVGVNFACGDGPFLTPAPVGLAPNYNGATGIPAINFNGLGGCACY